MRRVAKRRSEVCKAAAAAIRPSLPPEQQLLLEVAGERGVSSWLTADPSPSFNTVLRKGDFRDAVCLRYGLPFASLPTSCVCGQPLSVHHALTCPCGGYPSARHDTLRDVIAEAMEEVLSDVEREPVLASLDGETLQGRTANRADDARVDIRAGGFWTRQQDAYFDVRVTHLKASVLSLPEALQQLKIHEGAKKRQYGQ